MTQAPFPSRRSLLAAGLAAAILAAALASAAACATQHDEDDQTPPASAPALPPGVVQLTPAQQAAVRLRTAVVREVNLPRSVTLPAQVELPTGHSAEVRAPVTGYVAAPGSGIPTIGSRVRGGELLATVQEAYTGTEQLQMQVNLRSEQAGVESARAQLTLARSQLRRSQLLYKKGIAPFKQVQQDEAASAEAGSAYQSARARLGEYRSAAGNGAGPSRFELRAPMMGRVAAVSAAPGELVQARQALFTIVNESVIWVAAAVPEDEIAGAGQTASAALLLAAYPGHRFALRRIASTGVVNPATHTLTVIFAAPNRQGELKPGMVGTIEIQSARRSPVPVVPQSALIYEPYRTFVFVAAGNGTFRQQAVTVEYIAHGSAAITSGLSAGERVVTGGAGLLASQLRRHEILEVD